MSASLIIVTTMVLISVKIIFEVSDNIVLYFFIALNFRKPMRTMLQDSGKISIADFGIPNN